MEVNTMNMMNGYYGQQDPYAANPYMGGQNPYFMGQPTYYNQAMQAPSNQNALTNEEIQRLRSTRPTDTLNLSVEPEEILRAMCTHKDNGRDVVQMVQDGSGDVWCPICGKRWSPEQLSLEEVTDLTNRLIGQMQNARWSGEYPQAVAREYFAMIPLLEKFPELFKYATKNFNRYMGQAGMFNAQDANIYNMYNSLFTGGAGAYGYAQPNPYMASGAMAMKPAAPVQQANPAINPMQAPVYGAPGFNPQFANQANIMMNGTYYHQPVNPYMAAPSQAPQAGVGYNPVFNNTAAAPQAGQVAAPAADAAAADTKADL